MPYYTTILANPQEVASCWPFLTLWKNRSSSCHSEESHCWLTDWECGQSVSWWHSAMKANGSLGNRQTLSALRSDSDKTTAQSGGRVVTMAVKTLQNDLTTATARWQNQLTALWYLGSVAGTQLQGYPAQSDSSQDQEITSSFIFCEKLILCSVCCVKKHNDADNLALT